MKHPNLNRPISPRGQSILIAIGVLGFLGVIFGAMTTTLSIHGERAKLNGMRDLARHLAFAGTERAIHELRKDTNEYDALTEPWHINPEAYDKVGLGRGFYNVYHLSATAGARTSGIVDEDRKINVNLATRAMLRAIPGISEKIADVILEQRAKTPFLSIKELVELPGIETPWLTSREALAGGPESVLTVHGDGKVNINTASATVLDALPGLSEEHAKDIVAYRAGDDGEIHTEDDGVFTEVGQLKEVAGLTDEQFESLAPRIKVRSDYFSMVASGRIQTSRVPVQVECRRTVKRENGRITTLLISYRPTR